MFSISLLIIAAAIVYMVEAYIHTYYAVEYMHGTPLFFVLLAQYGVPVLFLLLCAHIIYKQTEKKREKEQSKTDTQAESKEEKYLTQINAVVGTKAIFSEQADQMRYQVRRFGQKMATAYNMTQDSKTSGEQAKCLILLASAEKIFYDRLDDAIRSASMFDENEYKASKSKESQESIPESEMQEFLDAVANGLLYIEKERKSRYQRIDEAEKTAFARGEAEGKEDKLIATVRELEEKQALREEQENKLYHEALSHTISFRSTRTEWVRLSRGGW